MMSFSIIDEPEDQIRFEDIYESYHKQMLFVANRILENKDDAEDAVQDALFRIARNLHALHDRDEWAVRGYVLTVAKNSALNILRKKDHSQRILHNLPYKAHENDTVFDQVINALDYDLLLRAVQHLDPVYRQVMILVYIQKQTPKEAADILGRKVDTVRKQLSRGRKLLLEYCRKEGLNYGDE